MEKNIKYIIILYAVTVIMLITGQFFMNDEIVLINIGLGILNCLLGVVVLKYAYNKYTQKADG